MIELGCCFVGESSRLQYCYQAQLLRWPLLPPGELFIISLAFKNIVALYQHVGSFGNEVMKKIV